MAFGNDFFGLRDRWALVTGASGGIGAGIAFELARAQVNVIVHYRTNREGAETVARQVTEAGCAARLCGADLTEQGCAASMLDSLENDGQFPTLIVNNAALQPISGYADMSDEEWNEVLSANLTACHMMILECAKRWIRSKLNGAIVNIASIEGIDPALGHAHYASSKSGLLMLTKASALELGSHGIRVNAVSPGLIHRDGLEEQWPEGVARWQDRAPLGRLGRPRDVANAVLFLLSDAADWVSGANLIVDGGMSVQSRW